MIVYGRLAGLIFESTQGKHMCVLLRAAAKGKPKLRKDNTANYGHVLIAARVGKRTKD